MEATLLTYGPLGIGWLVAGYIIREVLRMRRDDLAAMAAQYESRLSKMGDDLKAERESHQKTRDGWTADLRLSNSQADSLDRMRSEIARISTPGRSAA